jgi:Tfp pilus assembly protein PilO
MKNRSGPRLLAVFGLVVLLGAYMLLWKPRADDVASVHSERDALTHELTVLQAVGTGTTTTTAPGVVSAMALAVPATADLPNVLRQLKAIGADLGIDVQTITPAPVASIPTAAGGSVAISLAGSGSQQAVDTYVARLTAMPRVFVIDKLSVSSNPAGGSGPDAQTPTSVGNVRLAIDARIFTTQAPVAPVGAPIPAPAPATTTATTAAHG